MNIELRIAHTASSAISNLFGSSISADEIQIQPTRKEFDGEFTIVVFPLVKISRKSPEQTASALGDQIQELVPEVEAYSVVKGFLNLKLSAGFWSENLAEVLAQKHYGHQEAGSKGLVLVEYSSPNTNKPLHLGHLRNNFLGFAVSQILKAWGHEVKKVQIINDRGIHICKSMVAWQKFGNGETPESTGIKGDHLVGKYYVAFDKAYKSEVAELIAQGSSAEEAENRAPILREAREVLLKWEQKDPEVYALWERMNGWVYAGFETTYTRMGVDFDKLYYESNTWSLGKDVAISGVEKGLFSQRDDKSVWVDLTDLGMDEKLLLRKDGTSVYMTQDIGTAILRYRDFPTTEMMVYTVGNEQEYHFKVLFAILAKLGYSWAESCYHLSYGMVELPEGKMKSREGTVVDADELMQAMSDAAKSLTESLGKVDGLDEKGRDDLYEMIGMAALKYFLLKVDPRKGMLFNPEESVDFNGHTGPFIQYAYARIQSLLQKYGKPLPAQAQKVNITSFERNLHLKIYQFPGIIEEAALSLNPAVVANYIFELVKDFSSFYQNVSVLQAESEALIAYRIQLSAAVARIIRSGMDLLGIRVPDRM